MAKEIIVNQYTSGLVRIDDMSQSIPPPGLTVNVDLTHAGPYWIATDYTANGEVVPRVFLPPSQTLIVDGVDVAVQPLDGQRQEGQLYYVVPRNIDIWCAGTIGANGQVSAKLYSKQNVPAAQDFSFRVAYIPEDLEEDTVQQYAYGTVTIGTKGTPDRGAFGIEQDNGETTHHFVNCYYMFGGVLYEAGSASAMTVESFAGQFVCLKVSTATDSAGSATLEGYGNLGILQSAQRDPAYFVSPLYKVDANGKVVADLRNAPTIQVAEVL